MNFGYKLIQKSIIGLLVFMACIFIPAQTLNYWQAWLYLFVFIGCSISLSLYLWKYNPALLERRMNAGPKAETRSSQKIIMRFIFLLFMLINVVPALDYHYQWSPVSLPFVLFGNGLLIIGFYINFLVLRANSFAAANIKIMTDQKVISAGPYAIVRHPMYSGSLIMIMGIPLALGSWLGMLIMIPFVWVISWRILDEEKLLRENLAGYKEYCTNVKWRLIPLIW